MNEILKTKTKRSKVLVVYQYYFFTQSCYVSFSFVLLDVLSLDTELISRQVNIVIISLGDEVSFIC